MTVIEMARELGKKIQQEESYIALMNAQKAVEEDDELQEKIAEFNMKRYELTQEITKADRDDKKIEELDKAVHELYHKLNIRHFLDDIVHSILQLSALISGQL